MASAEVKRKLDEPGLQKLFRHGLVPVFRVKNLNRQELALYLQPILSSYQVYANGMLLGDTGVMPPHGVFFGFQGALFNILPDEYPSPDLTIAIRVWHDPKLAGVMDGGIHDGNGFLGDPQVAPIRYTLRHFRAVWGENDVVILCISQGLACLAALGLFLLRRREYEYLSVRFHAISLCRRGLF